MKRGALGGAIRTQEPSRAGALDGPLASPLGACLALEVMAGHCWVTWDLVPQPPSSDLSDGEKMMPLWMQGSGWEELGRGDTGRPSTQGCSAAVLVTCLQGPWG